MGNCVGCFGNLERWLAVALVYAGLVVAGCSNGSGEENRTGRMMPDGGAPGGSGGTGGMGVAGSGGTGVGGQGGTPVALPQMNVSITAPEQGSFIDGNVVSIAGTSEHWDTADTITVNGAPVTPDNDGSWTWDVPLDGVTNPILVEMSRSEDGAFARDRITVVQGDSVADGDHSSGGLAIRVQESALDQMEPYMASTVGAGLDLGTLVPVGTRVIDNECFVDAGLLGCWGSASVDIVNPAPSFADLAIDLDPQEGQLGITASLYDLVINLWLDGEGLVPDCGLVFAASAATISGEYYMAPDPSDPGKIDVNTSDDVSVSLTDFTPMFSGGACDDPLIRAIVEAALPDIEPMATEAISGFLQDPDGNGPEDDPISDAAEAALSELSIAGTFGDTFGGTLDAPYFAIPLDENGMTLGSDGRITSTVVAEGAPDLVESYHVDVAFPEFANTSPGGADYGVAIALSPSFFNQLLKVTTENGLINAEITSFDALPLNAATFSLLMPGLAALPGETPLKLVLLPQMAPLMTGASGPMGELGELLMPNLIAEVRNADTEEVYAVLVIDVRTGLDMQIDPFGNLAMVLSAPAEEDVHVTVLSSDYGVNQELVDSLVPGMVAEAIPSIAGALGSFALPDILGFQLSVVGTERHNGYFGIYADLLP